MAPSEIHCEVFTPSNSWPPWKFFRLFCRLLFFSKINYFEKFFQKYHQCHKVWTQIRPNILLGLIWVQIVCKGYQQMTLVGKGLSLIHLPTIISRKNLFLILGVLGGFFHFSPNFDRTFCKQTVTILIRHLIMQCLI